jgi:murein DD-endopeptidase MepM/ murein hydrolase activator NlpD
MKKSLFFVGLLTVAVFLFYQIAPSEKPSPNRQLPLIIEHDRNEHKREITGLVRRGETFYDIFKKEGLALAELQEIYEASKKVFNLAKVRPYRSYIIVAKKTEDLSGEQIESLKYSVNDKKYLNVYRGEEGFYAEIVEVPYTKRYTVLSGTIKDNLIYAVGETREHLRLAFELADIFESEIDFVTELREGDSFKMLVEELWLGNVFKGYGNILAAEFVNNGRHYEAYRFDLDGKPGYFDSKGRSLRKALLRAPLRFRYISSRFSYRRKHPILKIYRPHLGVDYAAPFGTPVSSAGDGTVKFAGWKGHYGKCVIIRHPNGYETYYGHLSRIKKGIRRGRKVKQGEIIGYVGSTGMATGPHLDYRVKRFGKFVNPLRMSLPRAKAVPKNKMELFSKRVRTLQYMMNKLSGVPQTLQAQR